MSLYYKSFPESIQRQYWDKFKLLQLGIVTLNSYPFFDGNKRIESVTKWPDVEFGQIYCYFIDSPGEFT